MHVFIALTTLLAFVEPTIANDRVSNSAGSLAWLLIIAVCAIALIVVARRRTGGPGATKGSWRMRGGAGVGGALQDLQATLMPNHPDAAVIERIDEEGEHDEQGDGRKPPS